MFEKIEVIGKNAHDLYWYLRYHSRLQGGNIPWNFAKFLVDKKGNVIEYYEPNTAPNDIVPDIEKLL